VSYLTTRAFAARVGVVPETVRDWITQGRIAPAGRTPGGHYRFGESQVEEVLAGAIERTRPLARAIEAHVLGARAKLRARRAARAHGRVG